MNNTFLKPTDEYRHYLALEEIDKNSRISQRDLANKLGVALGIANACVHTLLKKGLIKIRGENNRGISYHLTKKGLLHKSKLAFEWTRNTIDYYRYARIDIKNKLLKLSDKKYKRFALYGSKEINEIADIVARELEIQVTTIEKMNNLLTLDSKNIDAILVTDIQIYPQVKELLQESKIKVLPFE